MTDAERATAGPEGNARVMARLLWRFEIMRRAEEQAEELRSAEGRLLWLLMQDDAPRTLKQIAQELQLEQSTANRQVNSALRTGLLRRFRERGTAAYLFEPTEHGAALYERSLRCHLARVNGALEALPANEREHFTHAFAAFIDAYARSTRVPGDGHDETDARGTSQGPQGRDEDRANPSRA